MPNSLGTGNIMLYNNGNVLVVGGKAMDRITESLIKEFATEREYQISDPNILFEKFVNYCIATKEYGTDQFDVEDLNTGIGVQGIDGIAIIVNQRIVNSVDDIDQLIELNQNIRVKFVLIQAKTSPGFDNSEISNFLSFSSVFFSENTSIFNTDEMQKFIELKNHIFERGAKLQANPELILYYVTLGNWTEDVNLRAAINVGIQNLRSTNLFSSVKVIPCGSEDIQNMYRKATSSLSATFKFEKRITMYSISDDEVGYSGVLPFSEYRKIILELSGTEKPVFEDNIRDFLGIKPEVNHAIEETIKSGDINAFSMLNNGIMVVANSVKLFGDIMTIEDYQVVNGCQTSNILIRNIDTAPSINDLVIPVRIIATKDENLKNDITRATNNQTAIKKEQLEALSTFQKKLEEYYKTYLSEPEALIYERRTGQHRNSVIPKSRIVNIPMQIKSVAAMFLNEPSGVSGQYGTVAKRVGNKIFKPSDKLMMYYVSALSQYKIENYYKTGVLDTKYRRARYHAMMLFRIIISGEDLPKFNQKKMDDYCRRIYDILTNRSECEVLFSGIVSFIISKGVDIEIDNRKCFERKETTDYLLSHISELRQYLSDNGY